MRIFLIGFMGCGKTSVGKFLAHKLKHKFIDTDDYIKKKKQKTISQIFKDYGEKFFRNYETKILKELIKKENIVLAVGGGTPCHSDNINLMNNAGITIYLKLSAKTLNKRLIKETRKRPLLADIKSDNLLNYITLLLKKREKYYQNASIIINGDDKTKEHICNEILEQLKYC